MMSAVFPAPISFIFCNTNFEEDRRICASYLGSGPESAQSKLFLWHLTRYVPLKPCIVNMSLLCNSACIRGRIACVSVWLRVSEYVKLKEGDKRADQVTRSRWRVADRFYWTQRSHSRASVVRWCQSYILTARQLGVRPAIPAIPYSLRFGSKCKARL